MRENMSPSPSPTFPNYYCIRTSAKVIRTTTRSVTKEEIAKFWRHKKMEEENHLLAALKAAARIRARNLTEEDYRQFEESLKDKSSEVNDNNKEDENIKELRIGIKDWFVIHLCTYPHIDMVFRWTKSIYAYLNQPDIGFKDSTTKRTSTSIPNFCFYKPPPPPPHTTSFGVF